MNEEQNPIRSQRIFKIGSTLIQEDETMRDKSHEEIRALLRHQYPEIAYATIREVPQAAEEGQEASIVVEFLPAAGRKG